MPTHLCPVREVAQATPDQSALLCGDKMITYREYDRLITSYAKILIEQSIRPNDRVAIAGHNCLTYPIAVFALIRIGAIVCPVNRFLPSSAVTDQFHLIDCNYFIDFDDTICDIPSTITKLSLPDFETSLPDTSSSPLHDFPQLDHDATIIFTSSSTGTAKPVVHTFGNHYYSALGSNDNIKLLPGDCWLLSLPLYHVGGLSIIFRCAIAGASLRIPDENESIEQTLSSYSVTHLSLVPTQLQRLLDFEPKRSLSKLKAVLVGGSSLPSGLIERALSSKLPLYTTYGLTETASQLTCTPPGSLCNDSGRLLSHRKLKIADDGEIFVGGKILFKQYVGQPVTGEWFGTGDLGSVDEQGNLTVIGRKDNMFISGGENIHPEPIERTLSDLSEIENAVVVPVEDAEFGYRPVAFIKWRAGYELTIAEIEDRLTDLLPKFQIPIKFLEYPASENSAALKPNRIALANLAEELYKSDLSE